MFNELLVEQGLALPLKAAHNHRFQARIQAAADRARRMGRGLWRRGCPARQ
jgi:endonuclease YncB( thermonuclease family)